MCNFLKNFLYFYFCELEEMIQKGDVLKRIMGKILRGENEDFLLNYKNIFLSLLSNARKRRQGNKGKKGKTRMREDLEINIMGRGGGVEGETEESQDFCLTEQTTTSRQ